MSGLNLHLDTFCEEHVSNNQIVWVDVANMINTRFAVDVAAKKVTAVVTTDRSVCNAVSTLKNAKSVIKTYGASESIMCIFNAGNMLADVIGMEIPEINASNAKAVGIACCENIDETIVDAYEKVKTFFDQIVESAGTFFNKLQTQAACQNAMIDRIISNISQDVVKINAVEYNNDELFGYTQPVFMERVNALQYINNNISTVGTTNEELRTFEPYLKVLGYKIVESANESLLEGDTPEEPALQIVPETPKEAEQTAPEPAEVLNPQPTLVTPEPVTEPAPVAQPAAQPEEVLTEPKPVLTGDPAEVISTETPDEQPSVQMTPVTPTVPADAPQTQTMTVFRWTPSNIVVAAGAVKKVLGTVDKFAGAYEVLNTVRTNVTKSIETIQTSVDDKTACEEVIANGRNYASFIGDVIAVYHASVNELVDQVLAMAGKLVTNKSDKGVAPEAITTEDPMGLNAKYVNEEPPAPDKEEKPEGKQAEPSNEEPAAAPKEGEEKKEDVKNEVETPENVPNDKPLDDPAKGVDPNGDPEPGKAPHIEPTETPEGEQPGKEAEPFLGDVFNTRLW